MVPQVACGTDNSLNINLQLSSFIVLRDGGNFKYDEAGKND